MNTTTTTTEPNAFFEVRTKSGDIFSPFPHSWQSALINCALTAVPFAARSLGTQNWDSIYRLKPLDIPGFVPPAADATREEWFRFLRAAAREFCTPVQLPAGRLTFGFDPLAVEYAGFTCVSASSAPDAPARFDYENGGCCRVSISVFRLDREQQSDSALDKTLAVVEEWEEYLERRKGSDECVYQGGSRISASDLDRFHPDFYFRYFCRKTPQKRPETVIFAMRPFGDNYLSIEFVSEEYRSNLELPRFQRLLEIIKRMR